MEVRSTGDLRELFNKELYDQRTNVSKVAKKASVSQSPLNMFSNGKTGITADTMFAVMSSLNKKVLIEDMYEKDDAGAFIIPVKPPPIVEKKPLCLALQNRIEEYKDAPEPKERFSVSLIVEFLEECYDKLATI